MNKSNTPRKGSETEPADNRSIIAQVHAGTAAPEAAAAVKDRNAEPKPAPEMPESEREFGEGNYKAARNYDKAAEKFAKSGKVAAAAAAAAPRNPGEAAAMKRAEEEGARHDGKGTTPAAAPSRRRVKPS